MLEDDTLFKVENDGLMTSECLIVSFQYLKTC